MTQEHSFGNTLLKVSNMSLSYGDSVILRNVNCEIKDVHRSGVRQGQVVGLLAPSGMGKTKFFEVISGLIKPLPGKNPVYNLTGEVLIGAEQLPVERGSVGVLQQNYPLFRHRTIMGNLLVAARKGFPSFTKKEQHDKIDFYLDRFGLMSRKDYYPSELSGGQRQRIAIIQQLLCSKHFLLFDEPFSGLDILNIRQVLDLMRDISLLDELNTLIIVSHDVTSTSIISDHLWLMGRERDERGQVIPGAKILKEISLIERGLAWQPDIEKSQLFTDFVKEVKSLFPLL